MAAERSGHSSGSLLSVVDRSADALGASGSAGPGLVEVLKTEARRRAQTGSFFGYIAYASLIASKPQ